MVHCEPKRNKGVTNVFHNLQNVSGALSRAYGKQFSLKLDCDTCP